MALSNEHLTEISYLVTAKINPVDINDTETRSKISLYSYITPIIGILIIIINLAVVVSSGLILKKGILRSK